jgi:hypothetical protein
MRSKEPSKQSEEYIQLMLVVFYFQKMLNGHIHVQ